jgi:hypothetical protein
MFRAIILPIFRSIRLNDTACGIMHSICGRPVVWKRSSYASRPPAGYILSALYHKLYRSVAQSLNRSIAPEYGQNNCPKHVELNGIINKQLLLYLVLIINKQLLLHLVGCLLCYSYQRCTAKQVSNFIFVPLSSSLKILKSRQE